MTLPPVGGFWEGDRRGTSARAPIDDRRRLLRAGQRVDHAVLLRLLRPGAAHPRSDGGLALRVDGPGELHRCAHRRDPHRPLRAADRHDRRTRRRGRRGRGDRAHRDRRAGLRGGDRRVPRDGRPLSGRDRDAHPDGARGRARACLRHPVHAPQRRTRRGRPHLIGPRRRLLGRVVPAALPHRRAELPGVHRGGGQPAQGHRRGPGRRAAHRRFRRDPGRAGRRVARGPGRSHPAASGGRFRRRRHLRLRANGGRLHGIRNRGR